jgi:hypothetical protein
LIQTPASALDESALLGKIHIFLTLDAAIGLAEDYFPQICVYELRISYASLLFYAGLCQPILCHLVCRPQGLPV